MTNHPNRSKSADLRALIRKHYEDQGYEVRISRGGHVTFRKAGEPWLEGRWISEYRVHDGAAVLT